MGVLCILISSYIKNILIIGLFILVVNFILNPSFLGGFQLARQSENQCTLESVPHKATQMVKGKQI